MYAFFQDDGDNADDTPVTPPTEGGDEETTEGGDNAGDDNASDDNSSDDQQGGL